MAHQPLTTTAPQSTSASTREQLDKLAAAAAATVLQPKPEPPAEPPAPVEPAPSTPTEITLAYGATGEPVTRLVDLLAVLGYHTNAVIKGGEPVLDETVLADLADAQAALQVAEPEAMSAAELGAGVAGKLVGEATWTALYAAAAAKLTPAGGEPSA